MKKVLIISYMFKPDNNPRSFRAYELANELGKKYDVTVLTKVNNRISDMKNEKFNILEIPSGFLFNKNQVANNTEVSLKKIKKNSIYTLFKNLYNYMFYSREIEFAFEIYKKLLKTTEEYDVVISIANPFSCHIGTWLSFKGKVKKPKIILDYGDPFFKNPCFKIAKYFKWIEQKIIKFSDYIVVPIENAISAFDIYKSNEKIKVIPQGVDIKRFVISKYTKNEIPCFMYAGAFYEDIRNPIPFLEKIITTDLKFKFYINTDIEKINRTEMGAKILEIVEKSNDRIILNNVIGREECISKMATMDFLINFKNNCTVQSPSKLIDYGIAKRPVLFVDHLQDNIDEFKKFISGDYNGQNIINIDCYDIEKVAKQFEDLF